MGKNQIIIDQLVSDAIDEINIMRPHNPLKKEPETILLGENSAVDSIDFVSLLTIVEDNLRVSLKGKTTEVVDIVSDQAFSDKKSPFKTILSFKSFLSDKVDQLKVEL